MVNRKVPTWQMSHRKQSDETGQQREMSYSTGVSREGVSKEVTFEWRPEDYKGTRHAEHVQGEQKKIQWVQEIPCGVGSINRAPLIQHSHTIRICWMNNYKIYHLKKDQFRKMLLQLSQAARQVTALFFIPFPSSNTRGWAQAPAFQECWIQRAHLPKGQTLAAL